MVCVPCVTIPILLIIWRFLIQPLLIKWWKFKNKEKEVTNNEQPAHLVKECKNGVCTLSWKKNEDDKKTD
ncbi:UPF0729 protein AAEL015238 [Anthophora plagiata]